MARGYRSTNVGRLFTQWFDIVLASLYSHTMRRSEEGRPRLAAGDEVLVGATVYAETIIRPLQQGTDATVDEFLDSASIAVISIDRAIARRAAALRAEHPSLRLPEAMSLATAIITGSTLLTLDTKLRKTALRVEPPSL
jgi:predicted nucleic acid-binding protein